MNYNKCITIDDLVRKAAWEAIEDEKSLARITELKEQIKEIENEIACIKLHQNGYEQADWVSFLGSKIRQQIDIKKSLL